MSNVLFGRKHQVQMFSRKETVDLNSKQIVQGGHVDAHVFRVLRMSQLELLQGGIDRGGGMMSARSDCRERLKSDCRERLKCALLYGCSSGLEERVHESALLVGDKGALVGPEVALVLRLFSLLGIELNLEDAKK